MCASGIITEALKAHLTEYIPAQYTSGMSSRDYNSPTVHSAPSGVPTPVSEKRDPPNSLQPPQQAAPPYSPAPQQQQEMAEAMYDYQQTDASDLQLVRGARILILEKINPDWWRGRDIKSQQEGIFPSNYVRIVDAMSSYMSPQPGPKVASALYNPVPVMPYQSQYAATSPQPYSAPQPQQYFPPQQSEAAPQQQQQQQQMPYQNFLGKHGKTIGAKLGNAALFGAGASFGADMVNSIL